MVREYDSDRLFSTMVKTYRARHARIFEVLKRSDVVPKSLEEMVPLFLCAIHGCKAGLYVRTFDEVYYPRIFQGPQHFAMQRLGAVRPLIGVLSHFFESGNWAKPVDASRGGLPAQKLIQVLLHTGMCHLQAQGYASREAQTCYEEAFRLVSPEATDSYFSILWGRWVTSLVKGQLLSSRLLADDLLALARKHNDEELLTEAYRVAGTTNYFRGNYKQALGELSSGLSHYVARGGRKRGVLYLTDPKVNGLAYSACSLWFAGFPDRAVVQGEQAVTFAEEMDLRFSLIVARVYVAWIYQYRRDLGQTERAARSALEHARTQGFQHWENGAEVLLGWVDMCDDHVHTAIERIERGIDGWRRNGARLILTYYYALLSEAYATAGRITRSIEVIDDAIELAESNDECFFQAELWRLKAEYTALMSKDDGERYAARSMEIAESQGALSLQLRTLTSWGKLSGSVGVRRDIWRRLKGLCNTISEGRDTWDFLAAERLMSTTSN
jgi:predicted ATPase